MKPKSMIVTLVLAALPLGPTVVAAQHEEHHAEQASQQDNSKAGMMKSNTLMMMTHQELTKVVDQVKEDLGALQKENDIVAIRQKLAQDLALLEQLQSKMKQHQSMMQGMPGSMMTDRMKEMKSAKEK